MREQTFYRIGRLFFCLIMAVYFLCGCTAAPTAAPEPTHTATVQPSEITAPTLTSSPAPTQTMTPEPTPLPLVWRQLYDGNDLARDTVTTILADPVDPNLVYAGMMNTGVYKSTDGGLTWLSSNRGMQNIKVVSMAIDPDNPNILYAGTLDGVYQSQDQGENWSYLVEGAHILLDPQNSSHLYAYRRRLFESTDRGNTWEIHELGCLDFWTVVIHPADGNTLYGSYLFGNGGCTNGVYRSTDGGRNWQLIGMEGKRIYSLGAAVDPNGQTYLYAGGITTFISKDGGETWREQNFGCNYLPSQPEKPDTVYCYNYAGGVILTAGKNWRILSGLESTDATVIRMDTTGKSERILAGGQGLYLSTNQGNTWTKQNQGIGTVRLQLKTDPDNQQIQFLAAYYGQDEQVCTLYRSKDGGTTWGRVNSGDHITWCGPSYGPDGNLYFLSDRHILKSTDAGTSWNSTILPFATYYWIFANPYRAGYFYAVAEEGLFYSEDSAYSWQKSEMDNPYPNAHHGRLYFAPGGNLIYNINGFNYSNDGGKKFHQCGTPEGYNAPESDTQLAIDPRDGKHIYLATNGGGIFVSRDGCGSWQPINEGMTGMVVNSVVIDEDNPQILYAGTESGAFVTFDEGQHWQAINDGLPGDRQVFSVQLDQDGNLYAATSFGVYKLESK